MTAKRFNSSTVNINVSSESFRQVPYMLYSMYDVPESETRIMVRPFHATPARVCNSARGLRNALT